MQESYFWIYLITSPTGSMYIGQTKNLRQRFYHYRAQSCRSQQRLYASLVKYGFENHVVTILHEGEMTKHECNVMEMFYIGFYQTFQSAHGLNLTPGGRVPAKQSWTNRLKRQRGPSKLIGRKPSALELFKMRENNPMKDPIARAKMQAACRTPEYREKHRRLIQSQKDFFAVHNGRPVEKLDKRTGQVLATYQSAALAARENSCDWNKIGQVCRGEDRRRSHAGFGWRYA